MLEFWFLTIQLHNLSRLAAFYPIVVLAATTAAIAFSLRATITRATFAWLAVNAVMFLYLLWLDVLVSSEFPDLRNIARLVTPFAMVFVFALKIRSVEQIRGVAAVYIGVVLLGALSMYYQVIFGPVAWFAEASSRAGVTRHASLLGSLSIFGTAVPFALLCLARYVRQPLLFCCCAVVLLFAAMLSLQKAALLGVVIAIPFLALLTSRRTLFIGFLFAAFVVVMLTQFMPLGFQDYFDAGVRYFFNSAYEADDVSIRQSIADRLVALPVEVVAAHGWQALLAGIGLRGGGGVFGFDDLPMAHNGLIDYIAIGGGAFLAYGLWVCLRLCVLMASMPELIRRRVINRPDGIFLVGLAALFLANLPFASGLQFHPNIAWIFALLVPVSMILQRKLRRVRGTDDRDATELMEN